MPISWPSSVPVEPARPPPPDLNPSSRPESTVLGRHSHLDMISPCAFDVASSDK